MGGEVAHRSAATHAQNNEQLFFKEKFLMYSKLVSYNENRTNVEPVYERTHDQKLATQQVRIQRDTCYQNVSDRFIDNTLSMAYRRRRSMNKGLTI